MPLEPVPASDHPAGTPPEANLPVPDHLAGTPPETDLPAPDHLAGTPPETDLPALPALVYDGDCGFCQRCADWIVTRLEVDVHVVASQQAPLAALGLNPEQAADAAWWIDGDRTQHRGHRAITAALGACGGSWARLGQALTWPGISLLAAAAYELIARNRHRLGCRNCLSKTTRGGPAISGVPAPSKSRFPSSQQ